MNCADPTEHRPHGSCDGNAQDTIARLKQEVARLTAENDTLCSAGNEDVPDVPTPAKGQVWCFGTNEDDLCTVVAVLVVEHNTFVVYRYTRFNDGELSIQEITKFLRTKRSAAHSVNLALR